MDADNKVAVSGSLITWILTLWSWYEQHTAAVVGLFAIAASLVTTYSVITRGIRRRNRRKLEEAIKRGYDEDEEETTL